MTLKEMFEDLHLGQTEFQNIFFVVTKNGITLYGQYRQALRELYTRYKAIRDLVFKIRRVKLEIKLIEQDIEKEKNPIKRELYLLDKREKELLLEEYYRSLKATKLEFIDFFTIANNLKSQLGELDSEKLQRLEVDYWVQKLGLLASIDIQTNNHISKPTLELLMTLPPNLRDGILSQLNPEKELDKSPDPDNSDPGFKILK